MKNLLLSLGVIFLISCEEKTQKLQVLQGNAFGTTYTIQYFSGMQPVIEKGVDSVIYAVNKSVSTYLQNSDISKINRGDTTVVVDAIFREVYRISETVYTNSKGFFDPTVGTLRNAYGFGDEKPLAIIDSIRLDSLRQYVGFRKVAVLGNGTVKKKHPQIYLDFNAVAKGYGIDLLGNYLESRGVENFIIELGGEVLSKGKNLSKNSYWTAGIEAVDSQVENRTYNKVISLQDMGMAASGNYRKFRIDPQTGKKYVHTINPHTGKAEESDITSATVIAPTCALADAYATAFMAMGLENSRNLLPEIAYVDAYITYLDENGQTQVFITEGFKKLLVN